MQQLARIPRPTLSLDWLSGLGRLPKRRTILYLGYTSVLFLVCLVATFPHDLVIRRALSVVNQGNINVEFASAGLDWSSGYEVTGLRITPRNAPSETPFLECSRLYVRPALGQLLRGNPYALTIGADLYGGAVQGEVNLKGGNVTGDVALSGVSLGRYRPLTALLDEGQLGGRISGDFAFEARGPAFANGQGAGEIVLDNASISAAKVSGSSVPDTKMTQAKMKFKLAGGRMEIQDFTASGDLGVQGSGQIVLRDPLSESVLNLRATFLPSPATPAALKGALMLIPHQPGAKPDAPVTITGTLSRPKLR